MKKLFVFVWLIFLLTTCKSDEKIRLEYFPERWHYGEAPKLVFSGLQEKGVKTLYFEVDTFLRGGAKVRDTIVLVGMRNMPLGPHTVKFFIRYPDGRKQVIKKKFVLYAAKPPRKLDYEIVAEYPHDIHAFTQGLEFSGDTLYESTGQYGKSSLRKTDFTTGKILHIHRFSPKIFAEGLTIRGDSVLVLTWQNGKGFVFDRNFKQLGSFPYKKSKEGWGLCHNEKYIFKSDGTEKIWRLDPQTLAEKDFIPVYAYQNKIKRINELEWVNGWIFTNIWQKNGIAVIDPKTGEVKYVMDLSELLRKVKNHPELDVLNGIAWHRGRNTLFVTGKNWNKIFELRLKFPKNSSAAEHKPLPTR